MSVERGWFVGLDSPDDPLAIERIIDGSAQQPKPWPREAVTSNIVPDREIYYQWLHAATHAATIEAIARQDSAADRELIDTVRALDEVDRAAADLSERVVHWSTHRAGFPDGDDPDIVATIAAQEPEFPGDFRLVSLASCVVELSREAEELRSYIEDVAPDVAPNLAAMAGPVLAARLIALAGGLDKLAKMPSGTVQVLGAEDALFAHLRGRASSPKHGVIHGHEYLRNTSPDRRGAAARALAGKLAIAARIDHYSGERRPTLDQELAERIEHIRSTGPVQ